VRRDEVQVTRNGGSGAKESPDGKFLYYVKGGALWRMPVKGGEEMRVVEGASSSYAVTNTGIYFIPSGDAAIRFLDLTTQAIRTVAVLDRLARTGLTVSPDGRTILFAQVDNYDVDLMLMENFR
jgi:Tol biopolymer transport system component